jgi:hypothetical protein
MMRMILIACLLAVGCGSKPTTSDPSSPSQPSAPADPAAPAGSADPPDQCTTGDDCELVDACCGCNAGGKKIAIRKDAVAAFEATRAQRCGDVMCAQMISQDPSCSAEAICGNRNRCRVAPHMQQQ